MFVNGLDRVDPGNRPLRVAVLRALQLGDMLVAVPALRALRAALPEARIVLVGLAWARVFVERFAAYLDDLLVLPGYPGLPETPYVPERWPQFERAARAEGFALAVQLHGSGRLSNQIVARLGAQQLAGFYPAGAPLPERGHFWVWPETGPEVRRLNALMHHLGAPDTGEALEFPIWPADCAEAEALLSACALRPRQFVCLHPGARDPQRRWSPEHFARVGAHLQARGLAVVLTGTAAEGPLTAAVAARCPGAIDLAGRTSLGGLAALLAAGRLLVCNDTGVSHLAAATGSASVVLFSASDPERWAPLDRQRHRPVLAGATAAQVIAVVDQLLAECAYAA